MSLSRRAAGSIRGGMESFTGAGNDPWTIPANGDLGYTSAGTVVTQASALQLLAVNACVRLISETLSNMTLNSVKDNADGTSIKVAKPPIIVSDPFGGQNIMNGVTRKAGIAQLAVSALLQGNAYAYALTEDANGYATRLKVIPPGVMHCDVDDEGYRQYKVNNVPVDRTRVLHVTGMALPGSPIGLSVIEYARRTIGLAQAAEEYGSRFFGRGANMSGVIKVKGNLNPIQSRELKENFEARNSGLQNSHAVGVLTGDADFVKISVTPEEAQFLATRQMQNSDVAMMFGVPPHMLGQVERTTSWGKGIEEQTLGFVKFTLASWAQRFEDAWTAMLPKTQRAEFDFETLLRPDTSARFNAYQVARNSSILTPNEIRARENMPAVEGGDDLFAPLNSAHTTEPDWEPGEPEVPPAPGSKPDDNPDDPTDKKPKGKGK